MPSFVRPPALSGGSHSSLRCALRAGANMIHRPKGTDNRNQGTDNRNQGTDNRITGTGSGIPGTGSRLQGNGHGRCKSSRRSKTCSPREVPPHGTTARLPTPPTRHSPPYPGPLRALSSQRPAAKPALLFGAPSRRPPVRVLWAFLRRHCAVSRSLRQNAGAAPGRGSPLPHLRRDRAHPFLPHVLWDCAERKYAFDNMDVYLECRGCRPAYGDLACPP